MPHEGMVGEEGPRQSPQGEEEMLLFRATKLGSPGKCGASSLVIALLVPERQGFLQQGKGFRQLSGNGSNSSNVNLTK